MPLELTGRIIEIQEPETGTSAAGKNWIKQIFVIHYGDEIEKNTAFTVMRESAMAQLRTEVAELSIQVAEKILDESLDSAKQKKMVDKVLQQLPKN